MWATRLRGPIDLRWDAGVYYVLGTSLAEGKGYRLLNEPGEIHAIQYPPLLPAIVAACQLALGTGDTESVGRTLRLIYFLIYTSYLIAIYAMARRYLAAADSFLVAVMSALPFFVCFLSDLLFAEIPFALVTVLFVASDASGCRGRRFAATASLGILAYLLRTSGIALLAAWVAAGIARKDWRQVVMRGLVAIIPVLAWQAYIAHVRAVDDYKRPHYAYQRANYQYYNVGYDENARLVDPFVPELGLATADTLARRFIDNCATMPSALGRSLFTGRGYREVRAIGAVNIACLALGTMILASLVTWVARGEWLIPLYVAASLVMICSTPWPEQFGRYLAPLSGMLALSLVNLLRVIAGIPSSSGSETGRRIGGYCVNAVGVALVAKLAFSLVSVERVRLADVPVRGSRADQAPYHFYLHDQRWASLEDATRWLKDRAKGDEIVATMTPQMVYLATGLKAVMPPMEIDAAKAQALLDSVPVRYLIIDAVDIQSVISRYARPVVDRHPDLWELIHATPDGLTKVYSRKADSPRQRAPAPGS